MKRRWLAFLILVAFAGASFPGCAAGPFAERPLLSEVSVTPARIRPDGTGLTDQARIHYRLARRAAVTVAVVEPGGNTHLLRDAVMRAPDQYETPFDGSVPTGSGVDRRVLPDGSYALKIKAVDERGVELEAEASVAIEGADVSPLSVTNLVIQPTSISPNGDGKDDETKMSYSLSKKAEVTVFATDAEGNFALIQPPKEQEGEAGLAAPWDGKENGGRLLANGSYTIHVKAVDKAGNVTEATQEVAVENAGTPRMAITKVKFWPPIVPINGTLHVDITVKNIGDTIIRTKGPDPGARYTLKTNYATFRDEKDVPLYYEEPGYWRAGVMWSNSPQPYPVRWGFGKDLAPGEELTLGGEIAFDVELPRTGTFFWAGIEQGGVGFLDINKGQTEIRIAY